MHRLFNINTEAQQTTIHASCTKILKERLDARPKQNLESIKEELFRNLTRYVNFKRNRTLPQIKPDIPQELKNYFELFPENVPWVFEICRKAINAYNPYPNSRNPNLHKRKDHPPTNQPSKQTGIEGSSKKQKHVSKPRAQPILLDAETKKDIRDACTKLFHDKFFENGITNEKIATYREKFSQAIKDFFDPSIKDKSIKNIFPTPSNKKSKQPALRKRLLSLLDQNSEHSEEIIELCTRSITHYEPRDKSYQELIAENELKANLIFTPDDLNLSQSYLGLGGYSAEELFNLTEETFDNSYIPPGELFLTCDNSQQTENPSPESSDYVNLGDDDNSEVTVNPPQESLDLPISYNLSQSYGSSMFFWETYFQNLNSVINLENQNGISKTNKGPK